MGWNKRSSGHMYDSVSGHGFILGGLTQKVLHHKCMSKQCTKCFAAKEIKETPIPHECPQNHEGSSKSMEVEGIFRIIQESFYDHRYQLAVIVSDDDSTMKSNLKHSFQQKIDNGLMSIGDWPTTEKGNKKSDNGRLPLSINEPKFLADFNHRVKVIGKCVYALASMAKRDSEVTKVMAERVKTNWGLMLKQIRHLDFKKNYEKIKNKVRAPIEHMFNNHDHCDHAWCLPLKARKENKNFEPVENNPYYEKKKNFKMYQQLCSAVERFQEDENVRECLHMFNTQINESLNMCVSRYVPKFKHFGGTMALDSRVRCVIGVHNLGYANYYLALLDTLGCVKEIDVNNRLISNSILKIDHAKLNNKKGDRHPNINANGNMGAKLGPRDSCLKR